ncbi:uncharacterized protein ACIBXB_010089 isoform 2-T3 [Morphnus guianensis]
MGLPWPFARRGTSAAAEVPGPSGSGGGGALFGRPLAALCSQDGTLPQPIQVSKPGQGSPPPWLLRRGGAPSRGIPGGARGQSHFLPTSPTSSHTSIPPRPAPVRAVEPSTLAPAPEEGSPAPGPVSSQAALLLCPLQDLLALLHEHGPSTEGIFRLAASERASRELREALDSGAEVHLESQPAHLLAVVLKVNPADPEPGSSRLCRCRWAPARAGAKTQPPAHRPECRGCSLCSQWRWSKTHAEPLALQDFLRKIPSKLLEAELYEEWMSALQKSSRQEKLAGLKEVAGKLPEANLLLLKRLLALLQNISRNVATSRMTAGNLAICVGPNLLSPPEEHTLPLDALVQVTGKVTRLVEFLIEHHGELFEEEEEEEAAAGLAGASAEESPAPGAEAGTAEVPPVAPESEPPKSSSGERR